MDYTCTGNTIIYGIIIPNTENSKVTVFLLNFEVPSAFPALTRDVFSVVWYQSVILFAIVGHQRTARGAQIDWSLLAFTSIFGRRRVGADISWTGSGFSRVGDMFHGGD